MRTKMMDGRKYVKGEMSTKKRRKGQKSRDESEGDSVLSSGQRTKGGWIRVSHVATLEASCAFVFRRYSRRDARRDSRKYVSKYNRREKYQDRWINRQSDVNEGRERFQFAIAGFFVLKRLMGTIFFLSLLLAVQKCHCIDLHESN